MRERGERPAENPVPMNEASESKPTMAAPINWWRLDPEERAETLMVLMEWVPELVRRYPLPDVVVPPCWYRHEALVQELLALFQYRNQQQFLEIAPPGAPLDFHYQFQLAIGRMRSWVAVVGCNAGEHFDDQVQAWARPGSVQGAKWEVDGYEYVTKEQETWLAEMYEREAEE